jgi:hypothetical protein
MPRLLAVRGTAGGLDPGHRGGDHRQVDVLGEEHPDDLGPDDRVDLDRPRVDACMGGRVSSPPSQITMLSNVSMRPLALAVRSRRTMCTSSDI